MWQCIDSVLWVDDTCHAYDLWHIFITAWNNTNANTLLLVLPHKVCCEIFSWISLSDGCCPTGPMNVSAWHRGPKHGKMYIPRHHKHRIVALKMRFCWSKLAIFLCIICNLAKIRPQNNSASIQHPSFEDARTTLPTSISAPNFHQLLSWQWLWQDLSRCIMSYEVAWQHCQDSFRVSKSLQVIWCLWWSFEVFCSCSVYCWDATSLITLCWGGHVHVRRIWSRGMCFHCYVPLGQGFSSRFWEYEIGNWQVARDLGHSEVNQLVIGMDCSWHSTISILIFFDIRWYAMLPNGILLQHSKSSGSCSGRSVHIMTWECSSNAALETI